MKDEELINTNVFLSDVPTPQPTPYDLLVRQSKKLGIVATRAFHEIKHILHQEVALPSREQFLDTLPSLSRSIKPKIRQMELDRVVEFKEAVKKSHQVIANARTVFPITLFPDSVVLDRTKVSIIKRDFFWTSNVISFQIEDILNVSCSVGPLFGSLTIASRVMSTVDHFHVNYLWRGDAVFLKDLIQGYVIAKINKLKTDNLTREELIDTLCELGTDSDRR